MADTRTLTIRFKAEGGEKVSETLRTIKRDGDKVFTQVLKDGKLVSTTIRTIDLDLRKLGQTMIGVGQNMTRYLTLPIVAAGVGLVKLGMDAEETRNLVRQSFKEMTGAAEKWAETSTSAMVNTRLEAQRQAGMFFLMVKNMGVARDAAFQMGTSLADLTADMSSFYNLKPDEMFGRIQSGIAGEIEPLRRLGIALDENTVKTYALKEGIMKKGQELTQLQKVMIRYNLIMNQTSDSQGDLKRTADSATNQLRIQKAEFLESATALGESLIPVMNTLLKDVLKPLVDEFGELAKAYEGLDPQAQQIVLWSAAALAALGPLMTMLGNVTKALAFIKGVPAPVFVVPATALATGIAAGGAINDFRSGGPGGAGWGPGGDYQGGLDWQTGIALARQGGDWNQDVLSMMRGGQTTTPDGGLISTEDIRDAGGGGGGDKKKKGPKIRYATPLDAAGAAGLAGLWGVFSGASGGVTNTARKFLKDRLDLERLGNLDLGGAGAMAGIAGFRDLDLSGGGSLAALGQLSRQFDLGGNSRWLEEKRAEQEKIDAVVTNRMRLNNAFGQQGIASIAGGFMQGGVGGGISSALGVAGSALGPWGALAGGLLGNLVGGLFGKKKRQNRDGQTQATALIVQSQQLEDLKAIMLRVAPQLRQVGAGTNMALAAIRNQGGR